MSKAKKAGGTPASRKTSAAPASRRLNVRALIILAVVVVVVVPGFFALKLIQSHASQPSLLSEAKRAFEEQRYGNSLQFVNSFLQNRPTSVEALELKAKILTQVARDGHGAEEAVRVLNLILGQAPDRLDIRKKVIELNLKGGLFRAANTAAEDYLRSVDPSDGAKKPESPADVAQLAEAHRLMARSLEGIGYLGDPEALGTAIKEYERAEQIEPGDIDGGIRLAFLLRLKGNAKESQSMMDKLLAKNPKSIAVRLARFRFFLTQPAQGQNREENAKLAMQEIVEALKIAPGDLEAGILASEFATQRGDPKAAREYIKAISPQPKNDLRIKLIMGMIELQEQRPDDAIESWRSGLVQTGGSDAELTWRLARVLLSMGRVRDAEPLMAQYNRLVPGTTEPKPEYRYLAALANLKQGRTGEAISELVAIREKIGREFAAQHLITLGNAYEGIRAEDKAIDAYRNASRLAGSGAAPWLAIARIQLAKKPDEAMRTIEDGLVAVANDPTLLALRAQVLWQREVAKPKDRRDWAGVEAAIKVAKEFAPNSPEVAAVEADYLVATGQVTACLKLLADSTAAAPHTPAAIGLWNARANALGRLGRFDEAFAVLADAVKATGDNAVFRVTRARFLMDTGQVKVAREVLKEGLDRLPTDQWPLLWKALGEYHQSRSDFIAARKAFEEWVRLKPDSAEAYLALLNLAISANDIPAMEANLDAMKSALGAASLYWQSARAEVLLQRKPAEPDGKSPEEKARLDEVASLVKGIQEMAPNQPASYLLKARLMERLKRPDDAIEAYKKAIEYGGTQIALRPLVMLLVSQRRNDELEDLHRNTPSFPADLDRLAGAMTLQVGDAEKAEEMAKRMVQGDPESLDARVWMVRILNTNGKPQEAEEALKMLTSQRPEDPNPWVQLLMFQVAHRELPAARATLDTMKQKVKTERPELLWATCYRVLGLRNLADESFKDAIRRWPDDPKVRQAAVDYYESTSRNDVAEQSLRHILKIIPGLDWARRRLALNLSARINDPAAWSEAMILVKEDPTGADSPDDRMLRAIVLSRSTDPRQINEAIRVLEALSAEIPNSARLHEILARGYLGLKDRAKALDHAAKAASSDATNGATAEAILFYANLVLLEKNIPEAEQQLQRLVGIDPVAPSTIELNARVLHAKGNDRGAIDALRRGFEELKTTPEAVAIGSGILQIMVELGQPDEAEKLGPEVAKLGPKGQLKFAELLANRGKTKEARALQDAAFKAGGSGDAVRSALSLAAERGGDSPEWIDQTDGLLSLALKGQPESLDLLHAQAFLRHLQGNYDDEIKIYNSIMAKDPNNVIFLNNMAWTLSEEMGRPKEGLEKIDQALGKAGWQSHMADTRGVILLRLGRVDDAIKDLEAAAAALPTGPVYYHLAKAYKKAGNVAQFEKYRDLAKKAGLKREQLQRSERDEAEQMIGLAPAAPAGTSVSRS